MSVSVVTKTLICFYATFIFLSFMEQVNTVIIFFQKCRDCIAEALLQLCNHSALA